MTNKLGNTELSEKFMMIPVSIGYSLKKFYV